MRTSTSSLTSPGKTCRRLASPSWVSPRPPKIEPHSLLQTPPTSVWFRPLLQTLPITYGHLPPPHLPTYSPTPGPVHLHLALPLHS